MTLICTPSQSEHLSIVAKSPLWNSQQSITVPENLILKLFGSFHEQLFQRIHFNVTEIRLLESVVNVLVKISHSTFQKRLAGNDSSHVLYNSYSRYKLNKCVVLNLKKSNVDERRIETDCGATVKSLLTIFFGKTKGQKLNECLKRFSVTRIEDAFSCYSLRGLLDGKIICQLDLEAFLEKDELYAQIEYGSHHWMAGQALIKSWTQSRESFFKPMIGGRDLALVSRHCFNCPVLDKFEEDITALFKACIPFSPTIFPFRIMVREDWCFHTGVLEVFWSYSAEAPRFRIYQSCVGLRNLAEDMQQEGYKQDFPWEKTHGEFIQFFKTLKKSLCSKTEKPEEILEAQTSTFGFKSDVNMTYWTDTANNYPDDKIKQSKVIHGLTFRYLKCQYDPSKLFENLKNTII